jgi:hypothetical protein
MVVFVGILMESFLNANLSKPPAFSPLQYGFNPFKIKGKYNLAERRPL